MARLHVEGAGAWAHPGGSLGAWPAWPLALPTSFLRVFSRSLLWKPQLRTLLLAALESTASVLAGGRAFVMSGLKTKASVQWLWPPPPPPRPLERPLVDGEGDWARRRPSHPEAQPGSSHIISAHLPLARIRPMATLGVGGHPKCHPSLTGRSSTVSSPSVTAGGSHGLLHESERTGPSGAPTPKRISPGTPGRAWGKCHHRSWANRIPSRPSQTSRSSRSPRHARCLLGDVSAKASL